MTSSRNQKSFNTGTNNPATDRTGVPGAAGRNNRARASGFEMFDDLTGGIRRGHVLGVLAPPGDEANTLLLQTCADILARGMNILYASFAPPTVHFREIPLRIQALTAESATRTPEADESPTQRSAGGQNPQESLAQPGVGLCVDLSQSVGEDGIAIVADAVGDLQRCNFAPSLVAIHGLNMMISQRAAQSGGAVLAPNRYVATVCSEIRRLAIEAETQVIATWMPDDAVHAVPSPHLDKKRLSAVSRSFASAMDGCLYLGKPDRNGSMTIKADGLDAALKTVHTRFIRSYLEIFPAA